MKKEKIMSLLGSAVILGLGSGGVATTNAMEGRCGNMKGGGKAESQREMTCGGMMDKKEDQKEEMKKKQKEMTCAGQGGCGGMTKPKKEDSKS